jgi:hypothetical protein
VSEAAHTQLDEQATRAESTESFDSGIDHPGAGGQDAGRDLQLHRSGDGCIGRQPRPLVHRQALHPRRGASVSTPLDGGSRLDCTAASRSAAQVVFIEMMSFSAKAQIRLCA